MPIADVTYHPKVSGSPIEGPQDGDSQQLDFTTAVQGREMTEAMYARVVATDAAVRACAQVDGVDATTANSKLIPSGQWDWVFVPAGEKLSLVAAS